ncbi:MAG: hypothetical protein U0136_17125 [Bdellovibrionota bacterium]
MSESRVVPPWVMAGLLLSVLVGCTVLFFTPEGTSVTTVVLATGASTTLMWVAFGCYIARSIDPGLMIELTRAKTELAKVEAKSAAPILKAVGKLLGIKNPEQIEAGLAALIEAADAAHRKLDTSETRREIAGLEARLGVLKADIKTGETTLSGVNDRVTAARQTETELRESVGRLRSELGKLTNDVGNARKEVDRVQHTLALKNGELTRVTDEARDLGKTVGELKAEERRLSEALPGMRVSVQTLQGDIDGLDERKRELTGEVERLGQQQQELAGQVRDNTAELERLNRELIAKRGELETTEGRLTEITTQIDERGRELDQLLRDLEAAQDNVATAQIEASSASDEAERVQGSLDELKSLQQRLEHQLDHLLERYEAALQTINARDSAQAELEQARAQLILVGQQIQMRMASATAAPQSGGKVRNLSGGGCGTCRTLRAQVNELEAEVKRLKGATSA